VKPEAEVVSLSEVVNLVLVNGELDDLVLDEIWRMVLWIPHSVVVVEALVFVVIASSSLSKSSSQSSSSSVRAFRSSRLKNSTSTRYLARQRGSNCHVLIVIQLYELRSNARSSHISGCNMNRRSRTSSCHSCPAPGMGGAMYIRGFLLPHEELTSPS
jgi:hypothetical protein